VSRVDVTLFSFDLKIKMSVSFIFSFFDDDDGPCFLLLTDVHAVVRQKSFGRFLFAPHSSHPITPSSISLYSGTTHL
jgi:hypothetical protein